MGSARGGEYYITKPRWSSGKIYAPGDPSLGLKEDILFLEIVYFLKFWGSSEAAMGGGRAAPQWACKLAKQNGCAQPTGAHARPKPTSN